LLQRLVADSKEYEQYFRFKKEPLSKGFVQMALNSYVHPNVLCRLCAFRPNKREDAA